MFDYFLQFLGFDELVLIDNSMIETVLPALLCVFAGLTLYLFISFFQFIYHLLNRR